MTVRALVSQSEPCVGGAVPSLTRKWQVEVTGEDMKRTNGQKQVRVRVRDFH